MSEKTNRTVIKATINYPVLSQPKSINGSAAKYSGCFIIAKDDVESLNKYQEALKAAYRDGERKLMVGKVMPKLVLTSDVIIGFPGETEAEAADTISLVREAKFDALFTFIFSPRPGTPAAEMDDPVPHEEKAKWLAQILKTQEEISAQNMKLHAGKTFKCYVVGRGKLGGNYLAARTDGNLIIEFEGDDRLIGTFQNLKVIEPLTFVLKGELVN